jgi:hypothetical protein
MNASNLRHVVAAASGSAALCWTLAASAQSVVVTNPPPAPAPAPAAAPAPVVVAPQAAPAPAPAQTNVNVGAAPAEPGPGPATVEADSGGHWRPNRYLLMTGLIVAGAPYIASMAVAGTSGHDGDSDLWIPAIGPWLDVAQRGGCPRNGASCGPEIGNKALLVGDGILQSVGVLEIVGSFIFPEHEHVTTIQTSKAGDFVTLAPSRMGAGGYGLAAAGTF